MATKPKKAPASKVASFPQDKPVVKSAPAGKSPGGKDVPKTPVDPERAKLSLKIKTDEYESSPSASGAKSFNNGDDVAHALVGKAVEEIAKAIMKVTGEEGLETKYSHLNVGMQRMNLGNKIRAFLKKNPDKTADFKKAIK